jgi:hypothetical protein
MMSLTDILKSVFHSGRCDFCETDGLTYTDPETGCLYCLPCLVLATEPLADGPEDAGIIAIGRKVIATRRLAA